jgi:hypothetical protein
MNTVDESNVKRTLPFDAIDRAMQPAKANSDKYAELIEEAGRRRHQGEECVRSPSSR